MPGIFDGLKVLDLTRVVAGPLCTQLLADMGATVYKIEKPREGDDTRRMGPYLPDPQTGQPSNESAMYLAYNRGKHSVTVDIATPEGAALVQDLAARCDVFIENYKVGTLAKYGLDYEAVRQRRPDIIYASLTGFGQSGPAAARPAYDSVLQGMAGIMNTTGQPAGTPGGEPMRSGVYMVDTVTGLYTAVGVLSALYHRLATGEGQWLDSGMMDAAVSLTGHFAVGYLITGVVPTRQGNGSVVAGPGGVFQCADGPVMLAVANDGQFKGLCQALGCPEMALDERFRTNPQRMAHQPAMRAALDPLFAAQARADLIDACMRFGVPCGPVNDMAQVFAEPQAQHRELALRLPHARGVDVPAVRSPLRFSATPVVHKAPPMLGAQSEQVLADELGLTADQLRGLRERGII